MLHFLGQRGPVQQEILVNATKQHRGRLLLFALLALVAGGLVATTGYQPSSAGAEDGSSDKFAGKVQVAGSPVAGSEVTLYAAGEGQPVSLAQGKTGADGSFMLDIGQDSLVTGRLKLGHLWAPPN
jgi:hypothetical protein